MEEKETKENLKKEESTPNGLKEELKEWQEKAKNYLAGWQRARADFLNYKKEESERIKEYSSYATEGFILKILPILDNFELAEKKILENLKNDENPEGKPSASYRASIKGLLQIKIQLQDFLKNQGVQEIKSLGEKFDPNFHEVVEDIEKKDVESGIILEEIQKGYKINSRILRPTKVKITK